MRVLHLGPSEARGGISAVISILTDVNGKKASHSVLNTYSSRSLVGKVLAFFRARREIKAHLKSNSFDIYHIHCASDFSFIRKANYARLLLSREQHVILHLHSGNIVQWLKKKNRFKRYEDIFSNERMKVICLSDAWKERIQPLLGEVHVIENPVHPRHKPTKSKQEGKICLIGRKDSVKGHDFAIDLIDRLNKKGHDFHLYCTGITNSVSENTTALGWISEQKKVDLLSTSVLTLLPSKYEGLPLAALESLACKKVKNNQPLYPGRRFPNDVGRVHCHTLLNNNSGKNSDIYHIWYMNGNLKAKVRIRVRDGKEIPAFSHREINSKDKGTWKVEITDSDKKILDTVIFEVV